MVHGSVHLDMPPGDVARFHILGAPPRLKVIQRGVQAGNEQAYMLLLSENDAGLIGMRVSMPQVNVSESVHLELHMPLELQFRAINFRTFKYMI